MRRYFDEYRGLREVSGHVEPLQLGAAAREVRADARWMREQGVPATGARALAGALGRAPQRPARGVRARLARRAAARGRCSRRCRSNGGPARSAPSLRRRTATPPRCRTAATSARTRAPAPTRRSCASTATARRRSTTRCRAWPSAARCTSPIVIPPFARGSGGHNTIFTLIARLERMGHTCSIWMYDPHHRHHESACGAAPARSSTSSRRCAPRCTRASTTGTARTSRSPPAGTPPTRWRCCPTAARGPT